MLPVLCGRDNYAYLIWREPSRTAAVVDPSAYPCVSAALAGEKLTLGAILATHHHSDHVGGIPQLLRDSQDIPVFAGAADVEKIPEASRPVEDGEVIVAAGVELKAIGVPGHTRGSTAFLVEDAVFTGDTLFAGGCGRLFESRDPRIMHDSLNEKLAKLPPETRLFSGHEYAANNARFALEVEPDNAAARALAERAAAASARSEPTPSTTLAEERMHNPFLRVTEPALKRRYGTEDPIEVFGRLRADKDKFR
ncbi:MAG: hydroxyacylglutathione hydrolase [Polyangiaceae bacterium]|nr:hydroxyacylglutathione hydrolase [Polyangiaceae bacterium]